MLPCAAYLRGEYGVNGIYVGVPVIIGAKGVERIVEVKLDAIERSMFRKSVKAVRDLVTVTKNLQRKTPKSIRKKKGQK